MILHSHDVDPTKRDDAAFETDPVADRDVVEKLAASDAPTTDGAILTVNVGPGATLESRAEAVAMAEDAATRLADTIVAEEEADDEDDDDAGAKASSKPGNIDDTVFSAWAYRS